MTRLVLLGVDAAWKTTNPSGVAVASSLEGHNWQLECAVSSFQEFFRLTSIEEDGPIEQVPSRLVRAAARLGNGEVRVIAFDMPLSKVPIVGRRQADDEISRNYGGRWASTHSMVGEDAFHLSSLFTEGFGEVGFSLATLVDSEPTTALIEVYPHVALIELMSAEKRLEYKVGRIGRYWRNQTPQQRRLNLVQVWAKVVASLDEQIQGVAEHLVLPSPDQSKDGLKAFEDKLDAVICTYVAIEYLRGRAKAYGNQDAAIWGPKPMGVGP